MFNAELSSPRSNAATESAQWEANEAALVQLISFKVGKQTYGVDILAVREIRAWSETTVLPNTPECIRGVINLRGTILPILDLRSLIGQGLTEPTPIHVVIVVGVGGRTFGLLVDAVSDILSIVEGDVHSLPESGAKDEDNFLAGLITVDEDLVAVLDLHRLIASLSEC